MRYFIQLSYLGTAYCGWQIQENAPSVQETLNKALSVLFRQPVQTTGCGRTDTGVHASRFYTHFDAESVQMALSDAVHHLNGMLPEDIAIQRIIPLHNDAHARFDAVARSYEYRTHFKKDPFLNGSSVYMPQQYDIAIMNRFAAILPEQEDFSCFAKSGTQTGSNLCKITEAVWTESGHERIFRITADRFLRNMVRAIVGTLLEAGRHKLDEKAFRDILTGGNRSDAGPSVPAHGLYLTDIRYPYL